MALDEKSFEIFLFSFFFYVRVNEKGRNLGEKLFFDFTCHGVFLSKKLRSYTFMKLTINL